MKVTIKLYCLIIISLFLISCTDYEITPITSWKHSNSFPGAARASATSFVYGDKAYICLGRSGPKYDFLKDVWEYDSKTDTWTQKADFPGAARVKAIGAVIGNKAYVGLGAIAPYAGNQFGDFWEYDIANDSWKRLADFPGPGKNDLTCVVIDNCIYVTLGFDDTGFVKQTYKYNPQTNTWTQLKDCPIVRTAVAGFAIGPDFYVGTGYQSGNYKDFYKYDTQQDVWSRIADAPEAKVLAKGLSMNGKGYVLLGRHWDGTIDGGKLLSSVDRYNPETNTWTRCGDFPGGGRQNMVVFTINGKGYIVGGEDDAERKSDVWVFEP